MDPQTTLVAPLGDILDDFLHCEVVRVLHQAAELEAAMKLHQERMKDVCYSIKAHYLWENFKQFFPFSFSPILLALWGNHLPRVFHAPAFGPLRSEGAASG